MAIDESEVRLRFAKLALANQKQFFADRARDPRFDRIGSGTDLDTAASGAKEVDYFVLNDIGLRIPPSAINVTKRAYNKQWTTLRTQASQKTKSGHSIATISIDITFNGNEDINKRLRPLVAGLRATPFCVVYNKYLEDILTSPEDASLKDKKKVNKQYKHFAPVALALSSMTFANSPGQPTCIEGHFEFIWFNYLPYTPVMAFKTGPQNDQAGFAWNSILWKKFYQPFLSETAEVDWPQDDPHKDKKDKPTSFVYREFAMVSKGSAQSIQAAVELIKTLQKKPVSVILSLRKAFDDGVPGYDATANMNNVLDILFRRLIKDGVIKNADLLKQLQATEASGNRNSITNAGGPLIMPILSRLSNFAQAPSPSSSNSYFRPAGQIREEANKLRQQMEGAVKLLVKRNKKLEELAEQAPVELGGKKKEGFVIATTVTPKAPAGAGAATLGGLTLMARNNRFTLAPELGIVLENCMITFSNTLAVIPMAGYRYATVQHVGSIDAEIKFVLNTTNQAAAKLNQQYDKIENIALRFKQVPQGLLTVAIENDFLKLFGVKEYITDNIATETITGQPGRSSVVMNFSQSGITSKTTLSDPEVFRQENVQKDVHLFENIWKILNDNLTEQGLGAQEKNANGADTSSNTEYGLNRWKVKIIRVWEKKEPQMYALQEKAKNNYNRFLKNVHDRIFSNPPKINQRTGLIVAGNDKSRRIDREAITRLSAALDSLEQNDRAVGAFIPGIEAIKNSIKKRKAALHTQGLSAGVILGSNLNKKIRQQNRSRRLLDKALHNKTKKLDKVRSDNSQRKGDLEKLGLRAYLKEQNALFAEIEKTALKNSFFVHLDITQRERGLNRGIMAYPDFRLQMKSLASYDSNRNKVAGTPNKEVGEAALMEYHPDAYFWYPDYDGSKFSTGDLLKSFIGDDIRVEARAISNATYQNARGSVGDFFTGTYQRLLKGNDNSHQGPIKLLQQGKDGIVPLADDLYVVGGQGIDIQNTLMQGDVTKTVSPDPIAKMHTNKISKVPLAGSNICIHTTNQQSQWNGVPVGTDGRAIKSASGEAFGPPRPLQLGPGIPIRSPIRFRKWQIQVIRKIRPIVVREAKKRGIDPAVILAVIYTESKFNPDIFSKDKNGKGIAFGLMQLKKKVRDKQGKKVDSGFLKSARKKSVDIREINHNISQGVKYLAIQLRKFKSAGPHALEVGIGAYNMGGGGMRSWRAGIKLVRAGVPPEKIKNKNYHKAIKRYGTIGSPTGATPSKHYNDYQGKILSRIPQFREILKTNNFEYKNNTQKAKPSRVSKERIDKMQARHVPANVTTPVTSPMNLAIEEFTKNLLSGQGQSLMRAYPTFKLYFIEDDSAERTRLAFDDFFSYNAVQEIRVIRSRKIAADLCTIALTNVSGVLSNRKFRQFKGGDKPKDSKGATIKETKNSQQAGTIKENPIVSLLLQEGMGIHLRMGYSSDPDELDVVFTGQITGVQFSEGEDQVNIIAQSYAIELATDIKGVSKPDESSLKKFNSIGLFGWDFWGFKNNAATGRILEEMLAEPEVIHFGRWKANFGGANPVRDILTDRFTWNPQPADDNIFAPSPSQDLEQLGDGLILSRLKYIIYKTTIWDIFKELELRHPNFISSPVPYKGKFGERMTMFFGLPNQLYFARHPKIEEERKDEIMQKAAKLAASKVPLSSSRIARMAGEKTHWVKDRGKQDEEISTVVAPIQRARLQAATKAGFIKPFRNYHLINSKQHIIANNIRTNSRDVANTIVVKYGSDVDVSGSLGDDDVSGISIKGEEEQYTLKLDNALPAEDIRTLMGQFVNVTNPALAKRYALSLLTRSLKEIYKGEVIILGNGKIKPYDVCYLFDEYTDMVGPIEVEEVQHVFDQDSGFRTEIKPDMLVQASEWSILSSAEGMGVVAEGVIRKLFGDSTTGNFFSPFANTIGAGINMFGGMMANKIINFTQLAQPVVMSPLQHHGRPFTGGVPIRKINTSMWQTVFGKWSPSIDEGYSDWIEDTSDDLINAANNFIGKNSVGSFWNGGTKVYDQDK